MVVVVCILQERRRSRFDRWSTGMTEGGSSVECIRGKAGEEDRYVMAARSYFLAP